jgi:hypothetical protein
MALKKSHIPIIPFTVPCQLLDIPAPQNPNIIATTPPTIILAGVWRPGINPQIINQIPAAKSIHPCHMTILLSLQV